MFMDNRLFADFSFVVKKGTFEEEKLLEYIKETDNINILDSDNIIENTIIDENTSVTS